MTSIWKDYAVDLGAPAVDFRVVLGVGGPVIYNGRSVAAPGATNAVAFINSICADYMAAHSLPEFGAADFVPQTLSQVFTVETFTAGQWTEADSVEFLADWSYDRAWDLSLGLSFPISRRLDGRQPLMISVLTDEESLSAVITMQDGTSFTKSLTVHRTADFNEDYNADYARDEDDAPYGVVLLDLGTIPGAAKVELLDRVYEVGGACQRYALAYVNEYGGWDSFLPAAHELLTDSYTRHTRQVVYDNSDSQARGLQNYANEIARGIRFRTDALTDAGAANMRHLLGSTCVYLYDMTEGLWYPVVITDSSCERRTFRNQGGRVSYTFNVRLAADMIRR